MKNLLSPAALAYVASILPMGAAYLEAAGDMTPPPVPRRTTRPAPRQVIDNRLLLAFILATQNGRSGPAGDEDVVDGEFEVWD